MARQRYTSTSPNFSNDFMYQAPWELAMNALQFNQAQVDTIYDQANILGDAINVPHLTQDKDNVLQEQQLVQSQVDEITSAITEDPTQWRKQIGKIRQVSQDLKNNLQTGNLSKIKQSYDSYQALLKQYEDLAKKEPATVTEAVNKYLSDWGSNNVRGSLDNVFQGGPIYGKASLFDDRYQKILKEMKPEENSVIQGLYKVDNKWVTAERAQSAAIQLALSDPDMVNYVKQRGWIGDTSYSSPIFIDVDSNGNILSETEAKELNDQFSKQVEDYMNIVQDPAKRALYTPQELQEMADSITPLTTRTLNPNNAVAQQASALGNIYSFRSVNMKGDSVGLAQFNQAQQNARQARQFAHAKEMQQSSQEFNAEQKAKDREHQKDLLNIRLENSNKAKASGRSKGKGASKQEEIETPENTFGGTTTYPIPVKNSILDNLITAKSNQAIPFDRTLAESKLLSVASSTTAELLNPNSKVDNKNTREVANFIAYVNAAVNNGDETVLSKIQKGESLIEHYLKEARVSAPDDFEGGNQGDKTITVSPTGSMGSGGASRPYETSAELLRQNNYLNLTRRLIQDADKKYQETFRQKHQDASELNRFAKADFYGLNTKSEASKELEYNLNINKHNYTFFSPNNEFSTPVETPDDVKLLNIAQPSGAGMIAYNVTDKKGNKYFVVPNSATAEKDIQAVRKNYKTLFSEKEEGRIPEIDLMFGNQGKNAKFANAYYSVQNVGQMRKIPFNVQGSNKKVTVSINNVGDEVQAVFSSPGKKTERVVVSNKKTTQTDANMFNNVTTFLDEYARKNNLSIQY